MAWHRLLENGWYAYTAAGHKTFWADEYSAPLGTAAEAPPTAPTTSGIWLRRYTGGMVLVNRTKCTGCKACIASCPYGARFVDPASGTVDKCTFCVHRIQNGVPTTACQDVCPTSSIYFGDLNDPGSEISQARRARPSGTLLPEAGTEPRHYFLR